MTNEIRKDRSKIPDADYLRREARGEFRWNHRMEPDPLEGFVAGSITPGIIEPADAPSTAEEPTNF